MPTQSCSGNFARVRDKNCKIWLVSYKKMKKEKMQYTGFSVSIFFHVADIAVLIAKKGLFVKKLRKKLFEN